MKTTKVIIKETLDICVRELNELQTQNISLEGYSAVGNLHGAMQRLIEKKAQVYILQYLRAKIRRERTMAAK